ncbi:nodulation protein NfeD [Alcaligenaceae bacterium]|nr:nodulation protein NfeD [Alcaligenaceae bacterium]
MNRTRIAWFACIFFLATLALGVQLSVKANEQLPKVTVLHVDGIISPATSDFITRGLRQAAENGSTLALIELDTPGGLDSSMRAIIRQILASPIPVATFVGPSGARAASAGTFILYASHIAAMTPASNLGAATPVAIGMPGAGSSDKEEGQDKENKPDAMAAKAVNDAAAYIRSLAQLRGRNADFAEQAVRQAHSMSAQEALKAGVIDVIASNVPQLLEQIDGRQVKLDGGDTVSLRTAQATIERIEPGWRTQALALLANPQVALILMMVGIYGLFFELMSPGAALPGVAGLICLLLALYAFQLLPVNWAGVGLIAAGTAMMIAETFLPSFGALGVGGVIAFVLGGLFLTDTGIPGFDLSLPFLAGLAVVSAGLLIAIGTMALRVRKRAVVSGREDMLGATGRITSSKNGMIYAQVRGESWRVRASEPLSLGDEVRVIALEGLVLQVVRSSQAGTERLAN